MKHIISIIFLIAITVSAAAQDMQTIAILLNDKTYAKIVVPTSAKINNTKNELSFVMPNATLSITKNKFTKWLEATPQFVQDSISSGAPSVSFCEDSIIFNNPQQHQFPAVLDENNKLVKQYRESFKVIDFIFSDYKPGRYRVLFNNKFDSFIDLP